MKTKLLAFAIAVLVAMGGPASASDHAMKPFILASNEPGDMATAVAGVKAKITGAGFEIVGTYSPYATATIVIFTNDALKANAAKSEFGAYGAAQRASVTDMNGKIQVAYTNPSYMAGGYRMKGNLEGVTKTLVGALGKKMEYGPEDGMTEEDLREYHYMFGMEYFTDPQWLAEYAGYDEAIAAVEKGLAAGTMGVTKVYRIDVPGKKETVFGVALDGSKGGGNQQDDTFLMKEIDFKPIRSTAHLPYEMVVSDKIVYALSARFRIALNFPDLSMMGDNSFLNIMESPDAIKMALTAVAEGGNK